MDDKLLSTAEVAALFGLTRAAVYRWVFERRLPYIKTTGPRSRTLFRRQDVEAYIASRRVPSYSEQAAAKSRKAGPVLDAEILAALLRGAVERPEEGARALLAVLEGSTSPAFWKTLEALIPQLPDDLREELVQRLAHAGELLGAAKALRSGEQAPARGGR